MSDRPHCGGNEAEKTKKGGLFRLRKIRRRNKQPLSSNSCCVLNTNEKIGGCFMCLTKSPAEDFPAESNESKSCCSGYQVESLRSVIEKNEFFSKECNTHLDKETISSSCGTANANLRLNHGVTSLRICGVHPSENIWN